MNAEIYILRNMDTSGRISTALDSIAISLKSNGVNVAYKTELDENKDEIINSLAQSLQPEENIDIIVIPDGYDDNARDTLVFKTLFALSAYEDTKEKKQLKKLLKELNGDFKRVNEMTLANGKAGYCFVINGLKVILLPVMSPAEFKDIIPAMVQSVKNTSSNKGPVGNIQEKTAKQEQKLNNIVNAPKMHVEKNNNVENEGKTKKTVTPTNESDSTLLEEEPTETEQLLADNENADKLTIKSRTKEIDNTSKETPKKKKVGFKERFIPMKGDGGKEVARKIILDLAIIVFIVTAGFLVKYMVIDPLLNNQKYDEIRQMVKTDGEVATEVTTTPDGKTVVNKIAKSSTDWDALKAINSEVIGWVTINGTAIDYPVLQHKGDNDDYQYYLYKDIYKNYSGYGSIFADYRSKNGAKSKNVIMHGHHMNDGSMFQNLMGYGTYSADMDFYREHPTIEFNTPAGDATYKIISVFKTNTLDAHGDFFNYLVGSFASDAEFMNYVYLVRERSLIDTGVTCNEDDQLITLSTCSYEYSEFRTVVVARKTRAGENSKVDTSKAKANPDPLWPDVYYGYDSSAKPKVSTFKKANKANKIDWYDGEGNLKGTERMFTLHDNVTSVEDETEATETVENVTPTNAPATNPPATNPPIIQNQSILFNYSTLVLDVGQTDTLEIYWDPVDTTNKSIKWTSSNANVATIASGGKVTAVAPGKCTITAETSNNHKTTCEIIVNDILATSLTISSSSYTTSRIGETYALTATYEPSNASHKVSWASSNTNVATVTSAGIVKITGYGTCTITATIDTLTVSCNITVNKPEPNQANTQSE